MSENRDFRKIMPAMPHFSLYSVRKSWFKCPWNGFLAVYFSRLNVFSVKCPKIVIFEKLCTHFHLNVRTFKCESTVVDTSWFQRFVRITLQPSLLRDSQVTRLQYSWVLPKNNISWSPRPSQPAFWAWNPSDGSMGASSGCLRQSSGYKPISLVCEDNFATRSLGKEWGDLGGRPPKAGFFLCELFQKLIFYRMGVVSEY